MNIFFAVGTERREGPQVTINCPECEAKGVTVKSWEELNSIALFGLIPLKKTLNVFLRCPSCRKKPFTFIELDDLEGYGAEEIEEYLAMHRPFSNTLLAIVGGVFCWFPIFGFIMSGLAVLVNWRREGWIKTLSIVGLALSTIATGLFVIHVVQMSG